MTIADPYPKAKGGDMLFDQKHRLDALIVGQEDEAASARRALDRISHDAAELERKIDEIARSSGLVIVHQQVELDS